MIGDFNKSNKQPPIMMLCQDTLWKMTADKGLEYFFNDKNIIKEITK